MPKIQDIKCHKIVNSRGDWTIETIVILDDGSEGMAKVPSGASKGEHEAVYVPVEKAVKIVESVIKDALMGEDPSQQEILDKTLLDMDGTENKSNLGGNSILSVSLALSVAAANSLENELYEYLAQLYGQNMGSSDVKFPTPVFNILNGGKHANNDLSFQEFMVIPAKNTTFDKAINMGVKIYHELEKKLEREDYDVDVGDEGGFAPNGLTAESALDLIKEAVATHYKVGQQVFFGMDVAAGSFYKDHNNYYIKEENRRLTSEQLYKYFEELLKRYELIYLEDPFYEKDLSGWNSLYGRFSGKLMVVADDLVVTNTKFLKEAVDKRLANAVIVKPNQVGTLTETFDFIRAAKKANMDIVISHRSGDTEDTFIADLALAVEADFIKSGAPVRGERVAKYNRLLDIFSEINS
jgi:enolase